MKPSAKPLPLPTNKLSLILTLKAIEVFCGTFIIPLLQILIQQKFCDPWEISIPAIKEALESNGIPTIFLEFDVTVPIGQFKTRVEAFLEIIREEDLFQNKEEL